MEPLSGVHCSIRIQFNGDQKNPGLVTVHPIIRVKIDTLLISYTSFILTSKILIYTTIKEQLQQKNRQHQFQ